MSGWSISKGQMILKEKANIKVKEKISEVDLGAQAERMIGRVGTLRVKKKPHCQGG